MMANGNGAPQVCVNNLLRLSSGEVPFERLKGLDSRTKDRPVFMADAQLRQDADWLVSIYEPRAQIKSITVTQTDAAIGGFAVSVEIEDKGE
jgi:hypothetical protein